MEETTGIGQFVRGGQWAGGNNMKTFRLHSISILVFLLVQGVCYSQTWSDWKNGQSIGSFFGVAISPTATVAGGP